MIRPCSTKEDYPRVGGEEFSTLQAPFADAGLPPRGRGRGALDALVALDPRITPAWAGKSLMVAYSSGKCKDYPRVGGEEFAPEMSVQVVAGLPPRGRGRVFLW